MQVQVRDTILIASDSVKRRSQLRGMFEEQYNILEAENGRQAMILLEQNRLCIAVVVMEEELPVQDGYETLRQLSEAGFTAEIPVVMSLGKNVKGMAQQMFDLGAKDLIVHPYNSAVVKNRILSIADIYSRKWNDENIIEQQSETIMKSNETMVDALSYIIESRSLESGQHILRIRRFAKILLEEIAQLCPEYGLNEQVIQYITSAAALHDIGKIAIPEAILNKPGPLTEEEFQVMKTHSSAGSDILLKMGGMGDEQYLRYAYNICRHHHERWDGGGYPDGLKGDEIPICAQVVGLADAYDALTTPRVYKEAIHCRQATNMILNGECGEFSPKLLECFKQVRVEFEELARTYADGYSPKQDAIPAPLPGPKKADSDSMHTTLAKYQALLHHLNAVVMEIDLERNMYHIVYNPNPDFVPLEATTSLKKAMNRLAMRSVHPDDRALLTEQLGEYLEEFFASGLRKKTRRYRMHNAGGEYRWYDATVVRIDTDDNSRRGLCIWQESAVNKTSSGEISYGGMGVDGMSLLMGNTQRCRNDRYLTMENVSKRLSAMLDYTEDEIWEKFHGRLMELIVPEERENVRRQLSRQFDMGNWCEIELPMRRRDGQKVWAVGKGVLAMESDGTERIYGMLLDITNSKKTQEDLRMSVELQQLITEQSSDIIFEWDFSSDVLKVSPKWKERFGYEPISKNAGAELNSASHFHPDDLTIMLKKFGELRKGERFMEMVARIVDASGRYSWNRIRAASQLDDSGNGVRVVGVIADIDAELQLHSLHRINDGLDSLTKLLNKETARRKIEDSLAARADGKLSALAIIDLDDFKNVNDRYGHLFGDAVLTQVSDEISGMFRESDVVGRIGGDEFIVYMNDVPNKELVMNRCEKLINNISSLYKEGEHQCNMSCSVGVAFIPEHGTAYQELFQRADRALYQAKDRGKNCCVEYSLSAVISLHRTNISRSIDSNEQPGMANDSLVHYIFERLYESGDTYGTIQAALELIGRQMNVSRVYVFENNDDNTTCSNTFEWCNEGIAPEIDNLQNISYIDDIPEYDKNFNEQGIFYVPDVKRLPDNLREILEPQGIKSLLHCAIRDGGVFRGYVGFDECREVRLWTQEQTDLLTFLSQMLSMFLLKQRVQDRNELMLREVNNVLGNQYAWVYVIDPDDYSLRFINERARKLVPEAEVGAKCYECFMGRNEPCEICPAREGSCIVENRHLGLRVSAQSTKIHWNGKESRLITCRELENR